MDPNLNSLLVNLAAQVLFAVTQRGSTAAMAESPVAKAVARSAADCSDTEVTGALEAWARSEPFRQYLAALTEGTQDFDDQELVRIFVRTSGFYYAEETRVRAELVLASFSRNLEEELMTGEFAVLIHDRRQQIANNRLSGQIADLERRRVDLSSLFDGEVSQQEIDRWSDQFDEVDRPIATKLLCHFRYLSKRQLEVLVSEMATKVLAATDLPPDRVIVVAGADSSAYLAYQLARVGGLTQVSSLADIEQRLSQADWAICVPENVVALGSQAVHLWQSQFEPHTPIRAQIILAASVAMEAGVRRIRENTGFRVIACQQLGPEILPFSPESRVFPTTAERLEAEHVVMKYCRRANPNQPAGYGGLGGALLGFSHVTPSITLPIFWMEAPNWIPLLRRQNRPPVQDLPSVSLADQSAAEQVVGLLTQDLPNAVKDKLLYEFQGVKEAALFGDSALSVGATQEVVASFAGLVRDLAYHEHEREPVRSAILLAANPVAASEALGGFFFETDRNLRLEKSPEVMALAEMVDGLVGGVLADSAGPVVGNVGYGGHVVEVDRFQARRCGRAAMASAVTNGLLAVFLGEGRVAVLLRGKRILTRRGNTWYAHPADLEDSIDRLGNTHDVDAAALQRVFELAFTLSDQGRGALVTVGDHEAVLAYRVKRPTSHLRWTTKSIKNVSEGPVCGLMACDGATVLSRDGDVVDGMVTLHPPADTPCEVGVDKGTRHRTAAQVSANTDAVCITVSVTGEISAFSGGKKVLGAWA